MGTLEKAVISLLCFHMQHRKALCSKQWAGPATSILQMKAKDCFVFSPSAQPHTQQPLAPAVPLIICHMWHILQQHPQRDGAKSTLLCFLKGTETLTDGNSWGKFHSRKHFLIKNCIQSVWGFLLHMISLPLHTIPTAFHAAVLAGSSHTQGQHWGRGGQTSFEPTELQGFALCSVQF